MKKAMIFMVILLLFAGYLFYDWHTKTGAEDSKRAVTLYAWEDRRGVIHFDKIPPPGTRSISTIRGYAQEDPPLVIRIREAGWNFLHQLKNRVAELLQPEPDQNDNK